MKALGAAIAVSFILLAGSFTVPDASAQSIRLGPAASASTWTATVRTGEIDGIDGLLG